MEFKFLRLSTCIHSSDRSRSSGVALIELAITFPVALTIVLASVHIGAVLREANIIVEAARHGARSAAAQSGTDDVGNPNGAVAPTWSAGAPLITPPSQTCDLVPASNPGSASDTYGQYVARFAACDYLVRSGLTATDWQVDAQVINFNVAAPPLTRVVTISVTVSAISARGPVENRFYLIPQGMTMRAFFNIKPSSTSIFPLLRL